MKHLLTIVIFAVGATLLVGCAAPVQILVPAKEPLSTFRALEIAPPKNDVVGKIDRGLVGEIIDEAVEGLLDLKRFDTLVVAPQIVLKKKLADRVGSAGQFADSALPLAILHTTIVEYDEGNAFLRFLFGVLAGSGKVTLELSVVNRATGQEILKARTTAQISGAFASKNNVVGPLAKAIVKFVRENFIAKKS
jgi:hypothetical protein